MFCVTELVNLNDHLVPRHSNPSTKKTTHHKNVALDNKPRLTCLLLKFNGLGGGFPRVDMFTDSTGAPSGKLQMSNIIFPLRELRDSAFGLCLGSVLKSLSVRTKFGAGLLGECGPIFKSTPGAVSMSVGQFFLIGDVWLDEHDSGLT